jgi:capsular polysaccharide biosynthesis protein
MGNRPLRAVIVGLILGLLLAGIADIAVLSGQKTVYTSTAVMLIDDPYALATSGQPDEFANLDALRYKYAALVGTNSIAGPVAAELGIPVGDVIGAVSTKVPAYSLIMDVTATWSSPAEAQRLAQATAEQISTFITHEDDAYSIPASARFTFHVVDPAPPATAQTPSKSKAVSLAIGLGLLGFAVGFLFTQLVHFLRPR